MRKIKYIFVLLFAILIGLIIVYKIMNSNISNINTDAQILETNNKRITIQNSPVSIVKITELLLNKNSDWSDLPLSNNFKNKYNSKDGVLGEMQFDKVEISPYKDGKYPFEDYAYFVVTQGNKKTAYEYNFTFNSDGSLLDDIVLLNIHNLTDENGNDLDARIALTKDNFNSCFNSLARGNDDERSIAVTDRFHSKYPYFLDLFEHYSPLEFNKIEFMRDNSSWEKKEAYFVVDSRLECKKREYIVNFTLDDRGYLDDVAVKRVREEEYESSNEYRSVKLLYKKSNWNNLKITDRYINKFKGNSYNSDIDKIDIDYETIEELIEDKNYNEYLRQYRMKNGSTSVYYIKYIMDDKGNVDDIECIKLSYDNIPLKEAKSIYLKEHSN